MSRSTGPVLATGAITLVNSIVLDDTDVEWNDAAKVIVATGLVAGTLSLMERAAPDLAVTMAWATLIVMLFTRVNPEIPSPTERVVKWWDEASK